jgi:rhamnosyl/mannosyltransferase
VDILSLNEIPRLVIGEVRLSSMPFHLGSLRRRIKNYDLVHLHGPVPTFSDVFLLMAMRGLGGESPPLVYTHHAPVDLHIPLLYPLVNAYNRMQERLAGLADHVVVSSPAYGELLSRFVPRWKLSVIPWGVDHTRFFAPVRKTGAFTVVYLGQIRPYKGLPVLLKAVAGQPGMKVWVIGDGHYAPYCRSLSDQLDIPG